MRNLIFAIAAIPAAILASQASAQTYGSTNAYNNYGSANASSYENRIASLETRFAAGAQMGAFDRREYQRLSARLTQLRTMEQQYSYNGLSSAERRTLQTQIRSVRDEMRMAGGNGWANRYGWTDRDLDSGAYAYGNTDSNGYGNNGAYGYGNSTVRYDAYGRAIPDSNVTYDRYGRPVANNGVAYDRYGRPVSNGGVVYDQYGRPVANGGVTYDQYGRPVANNGYYGRGGEYEPVYNSRSSRSGAGDVLGGVLGNVMGGGSSGAGSVLGSVLGGGRLGVGSIITGAIAQVLRGGSNYGYRDTNNTYFRSDGQQVYEIDARTNQVVRIHPLR